MPQEDWQETSTKLRRRRWWRWLLALLFVLILLDETSTFIGFEPPPCGDAHDERIEGKTRDIFRVILIRTIDGWGERYWELEDGTLLRYDFKFFDNFAEDLQQTKWKTVERISRDVEIEGVEYPAPSYLDEAREELIEKGGYHATVVEEGMINRSCDMMAAVMLTPESYARYRAEHRLPPLPGLPPVPETDPE